LHCAGLKLYINTYQGENAVPLMKVAANEQTCMLPASFDLQFPWWKNVVFTKYEGS